MNRKAFRVGGLVVGLVVVVFAIGFLISRQESLDFIKDTNEMYAGTITALFTVVLVFVTAVYVALTYYQVKTTKRSVEVSESYLTQSERQLELSKIPVLLVDDIDAKGFPYFRTDHFKRRQLSVTCKIRNIGDSPAVTVYTKIFLRFKHLKYEWKDRLYEYSYIGSLKTGEEKEVHMTFETEIIEKLLEDLSINYTKNIFRVRNNPTQRAYMGTELVVDAMYVNVYQKHFTSRLVLPILDVYPLREGDSPEEEEKFIFTGTNLPDEKPFQVQLISPIFRDFAFSSLNADEAGKMIERYRALV